MIYTVVVTYNRLALLKKCLDAIFNQTIKSDKIIVVNNNSTDGTSSWLKEQKHIYTINQNNSGGAGGFKTGVEYAYKSGANWVWLMDDDVIASKNCLEELLKYSHISKCLQSSRISNDGINYQWGEYLDLRNYRKHKISEIEIAEKDYYFVNVGCFEGMLINSEVIEKIGFPDSRFFISGDDTIYGYLANQVTNVCCVKTATMYRAKKSKDNYVSPMYFYYTFRNFHLYEEYCYKIYKCHFSYKIKIRQLFISLSVILKLFVKRYSLLQKFIITKAIVMGVFHSKLKRINNSFL